MNIVTTIPEPSIFLTAEQIAASTLPGTDIPMSGAETIMAIPSVPGTSAKSEKPNKFEVLEIPVSTSTSFTLPKITGPSPTYFYDRRLTGRIADEVFRSFSQPSAMLGPDGHAFILRRNDNNSRVPIIALRKSHFPNEDIVAKIGDRWYRLPPSGKFDASIIAKEPSLWVGNVSLVDFLGVEHLGRGENLGDTNELYFDDDIPIPTNVLHGLSASPTSSAMAYLADHNPYLRLHAAISLVRRNWQKQGAVSLQYLDALRALGLSYLQQGMRVALGLNFLAPSIWPADWENQLIFLLTMLNHARGIRSIKVDPILTTAEQQRVFASRLRHRLEILPLADLNPNHIAAILKKGDLFRIPVRVEDETLVIDANKILKDKPYERVTRVGQSDIPFDFTLPSTSRMALDGILRLSEQGINRAQHSLRRTKHPIAAHYASRASASRTLQSESEPEQIGLPASVGFIRGGFGLGGASQEMQNLINALAPTLDQAGTKIFIASGFYQPGTVLPESADKTVLPSIDRQTHLDSITHHLFTETEVATEELQKRYDEAVNKSAHEIADWILKAGISTLIASQVTNPFENPVAFPAILGAKLLVEAKRNRPFPVVFRDNYFRDPEGLKPRIKIWADRHPYLSPELAGTFHLVDSQANQRIAKEQYGISSHVLPKWIHFDKDTVSPLNGTVKKMDRDEFLRKLADFEAKLKEPSAKFRAFLNENFGVPENAVLVLSPSRISKLKRIDTTLALANKVGKKLGNARPVHVLVLGNRTSVGYKTRWSGDEVETSKEIIQLAEELGMKDRVHFLGRIGHERNTQNPFTVSDIMRSSDIASQMSLEESYGLVYFESIAAGAITAMSNFRYPGSTFGPIFPVYQHTYASFNIFVQYLEEGGLNDGMIDRIVRVLTNDDERREMLYQNYCRALYSPHNETFALAYFMDLLAKLEF